MRAIVAVSVLGCLGLWGWALYSPKQAPVLPERYRGSFRVYRYEPGPNRGLTGQRGSHWPVPPQTGEGGVLRLS